MVLVELCKSCENSTRLAFAKLGFVVVSLCRRVFGYSELHWEGIMGVGSGQIRSEGQD